MKNQDITLSMIDMVKLAVIVSGAILTGCKMGPNFHPPEAPKTTSYTPSPALSHTKQAPSSTKGKAQHFRYNQYISKSWWTVFHSQALNSLIQKGLQNNPTVEMSQSSLRSAQANLLSTIGPSLFPTISTQFSGNHERTNLLAAGINLAQTPGASAVTLDNPFNLYNTSIGVSYNLDVFGGTRRQLESLHAEIEHQYFELEATYLTLTANIVTSAITIASLKAQIRTTEELIDCQQKWLRVTRNNYKLGHTTRLEVLTRENRLNETQASLPPLKDNLTKKTNALSVLIGTLPSESHIPNLQLEELHLPTQLPVSLPSMFVRQRPDIRSAESLLHKASAEIGVATANIFPKFVLVSNLIS